MANSPLETVSSKYDPGFPTVLKRALTAIRDAELDITDVDDMADRDLIRRVENLGPVGLVALRSYLAGIAGREPLDVWR